MRQVDVEADALGADVERAAVDGFHDSGTAAGRDDEVAALVDLTGSRNDPPELAGFLVEAALLQNALGTRNGAGEAGIFRRLSSDFLSGAELGLGDFARRDAGAAEYDNR